MKRFFLIFLSALLLLGFAGCKEEETAETVQPETTAPVTAETTPATTAATEPESGLLTQNVDGKVCIGIVPTEVGYWRYAVIPDQEAAVAAFEKAVNAKYSDEWWIKGDRTVGLMVEYAGNIWEFVESGELVCGIGRVKAEDAAELYALCAAAAADVGWKTAVQPEQIRGIVSATLRQDTAERVLTDPEALGKLETMLSGAKFSLGGTACPFNMLLDMELDTGETLTIALATDGCGAWMSEGSYYDFGSEGQPVYDLFGVMLDFGEIVE